MVGEKEGVRGWRGEGGCESMEGEGGCETWWGGRRV